MLTDEQMQDWAGAAAREQWRQETRRRGIACIIAGVLLLLTSRKR